MKFPKIVDDIGAGIHHHEVIGGDPLSRECDDAQLAPLEGMVL
jgi:hypothetical protein